MTAWTGDGLDVGERTALQLGSRNVGVADDLVGVVEEGKEDAVVGGEVGVHDNVEQPEVRGQACKAWQRVGKRAILS